MILSYRVTTEDVSALTTNWQILLDVTGDFSIYVNGEHWYGENDFCLVEFARDVFKWLQATEHSPVPLEYESVESEERPLLWIRPINSHQWGLGSTYERYQLKTTFSLHEIRRTLTGFVESLQADIAERFGKDFASRASRVITGVSPLE